MTVSVQTPLSAVLDDARTALGRRVSYLCFPGLSPGADANGSSELEPCAAGVLAHLTLDYDVGAALKEQAVNELRSRSPLPIRTDADAILGRAVDDFFERRFAEDAAAYCDRLRARLEGHAS